MRLNYETVLANPKKLISLTTLKREEFLSLSKYLEQWWEDYMEHFTLEGKVRQRKGYVRTNNTLPYPEDRLLFILYYLKNYPLQEAMAASFGMTQSQVSTWVQRLSSLLEKALDKQDCLPVRKGEQLRKALSKEHTVIIDGTERTIQRPSDQEVQKDYYSGKKTLILSRTI